MSQSHPPPPHEPGSGPETLQGLGGPVIPQGESIQNPNEVAHQKTLPAKGYQLSKDPKDTLVSSSEEESPKPLDLKSFERWGDHPDVPAGETLMGFDPKLAPTPRSDTLESSPRSDDAQSEAPDVTVVDETQVGEGVIHPRPPVDDPAMAKTLAPDELMEKYGEQISQETQKKLPWAQTMVSQEQAVISSQETLMGYENAPGLPQLSEAHGAQITSPGVNQPGQEGSLFNNLTREHPGRYDVVAAVGRGA